MNFKMLIVALAALLPLASAQRIGWKDSYSINGKCYCDTTFDHNIGGVMVDGPNGKITVREACRIAGSGPSGNRVYYNDVQCGNGPPNNAGDEHWCPGRVDLGNGNKSGCKVKGPKWDLGAPVVDNQQQGSNNGFFEEPVNQASGNVLTGLVVTNTADGSSSPLEGTIVLGSYPSGFGIRAEVSDPSFVNNVQFRASTGQGRTEYSHPYNMFGSGSWPNPPAGGVAVVTVVAAKKDGTSETIEANIQFV